MRIRSLLVTLVLLCGSPAFTAEDDGTRTIRFDGKEKPGVNYTISLHTSRRATYYMKAVGAKESPLRRENFEFFLNASLIYPDSDLSFARLTVSRVMLYRDSGATEYPRLAGAVIGIRRNASGKAETSLIRAPQADTNADSMSVLSGAPAGTAVPVSVIPPELEAALVSVFSREGAGLTAYFGSGRTAPRDLRWTPNVEPLLQSLKRRGIRALKREIRAEAHFVGSDSINGNPVSRVDCIMQSENIPGYDFKYSLSMLLPEAEPAPPVKISRSATEVVTKPLPDGSPFFSGTILECVEHEQTDLYFLPEPWTKAQKRFFLF